MRKNTAKEHQKQRLPKAITERYLYNSALAYLSRFAASTEHLKQVMIRKIERSCLYHKNQNKEECLSLLHITIKKLEDLGLLDDIGYARGMMNSLLSRGQSLNSIKQRLKNKGLSHDIITLVIEEYTDESDKDLDIQSALTLLKRKKIGPFGHSYNTDDTNDESDGFQKKTLEKNLATLARAGFSYNLSRNVLSMSTEEAYAVLDE